MERCKLRHLALILALLPVCNVIGGGQATQRLRRAQLCFSAANAPSMGFHRLTPDISQRDQRPSPLLPRIKSRFSRCKAGDALQFLMQSQGDASSETVLAGATEVEQAKAADFTTAQVLGEKYARALAAKALDSNGQNALRALVSTRDGARGFYVTALTVPSDDVDEMFRTALDPVLIDAIAASPDPNADLLSMNLAMSTAMTVTHAAMGNQQLADAARMTQQRTRALIAAAIGCFPELTAKLEEMEVAAAGAVDKGATDGEPGSGGYAAFLQRWSYGPAECGAILGQVRAALGKNV